MEKLLEHCFPSHTAQLEPARQQVRSTLEGLGCSREFIETSVLAVDEAVSNVIRHAYGPSAKGEVCLTITMDGAQLVFGIRDFAEPFDPGTLALPEPGELRAGGYGRLLMREIMDTVEYSNAVDGRGNLLEMRRSVELASQP